MRAVAVVLFFGLVALAAATSEYEYQNSFTKWMKHHNKAYTAEEFPLRYGAFKENYDYVNWWNAQNSTTVLGTNIMADLTNKEYRQLYLGMKIDARGLTFVQDEPNALRSLADNVDWRTSGAVTPIKNQGQCGSCWSFSTTGSVEGAYKLKTGKLVSLSEQNLMDCSTAYGNQGCNGGLMDNAFKYIIANKGIDTEASYPYTAKDGTCHFSTANIGATIATYKDVARGSEASLATMITQRPTSVAIDASHNSFQLYKSGVYNEPACSSTQLDHGVLAVGFAPNYYIVKNSWGTSWGMAGYIEMTRGANNQCGIATSASAPTA